MIRLLAIILLLFNAIDYLVCVDNPQKCQLAKYCTSLARCENFTSLQELSQTFHSGQVCDGYFQTANITSIDLIANRYEGPLNDRLNISALLDIILADGTNSTGFVGINLQGFAGVDFNTTRTPADNTGLLLRKRAMQQHGLRFASLDLFFNGPLLTMTSDHGRTCDETELLQALNQTSGNFFNLMPTLYFKTTKFQRKLCPLAFKNVLLGQVFTFGNALKFHKENSSGGDLNCVIKIFRLKSAVIRSLNKEILHPQVYAHTSEIQIERARSTRSRSMCSRS
jgi:hypothetical protein